MAVEEVRLRLRRKLEGMLGEDEAAMLMDRPPGGWSDLATNQSLAALTATLDARFDAIDRRFDSVDRRFDEVDRRFDVVDQKFETQEYKLNSRMDQLAREQTWRMMTAMVAALSILTAIVGILLAVTGR